MTGEKHIKLQNIAKLYFEKKGYKVMIECHLKNFSPKDCYTGKYRADNLVKFHYNAINNVSSYPKKFDLVLDKDNKLYGCQIFSFIGNSTLKKIKESIQKPKVFEDVFIIFPLFNKLDNKVENLKRWRKENPENTVELSNEENFLQENNYRIIRIMDEAFV